MRAVVAFCLLTSCFLLTALSQQLDVPDFHQRVIDQTNTLSPDEVRTLASSLEQFERETSYQVVVLMIPSLEGPGHGCHHRWGQAVSVAGGLRHLPDCVRRAIPQSLSHG